MRPSLDLVALVAANSARVAPDLVEPLARFMTTARKLCRGDFDKVLLMLVVVLRSNSHPGFKLAAESLVGDETGALPSFGTNARSLAESTGIPRETVRRKVREMVDDGWVIRKGNQIHYSLAAYKALEPVRMEVISAAVVAYQVVEALIGETT